MSHKTAVALPIPRVVVGIKRRARIQEPERLCVLDDVPVLLPAPSAEEAPVCVNARMSKYRAFGGALYRPLFDVHFSEGCKPEYAADVLRARGRREAGEDGHHDWRDKGELVVDVRRAFEPARKDRGLRSVEGHQLRETLDDGTSAQRRLAERIEENLILVDGGLWHRCPAPTLRIQVSGRTCDPDESTVSLHVFAEEPHHESVDAWRWRKRDVEYDEGPWLSFPAERGEDLAAYCRALYEQPWHGRGSTHLDGLRSIEVVDAALLSASRPPETPGSFLARATRHFLRASTPHLDDLLDHEIHAYAEARSAATALEAGLDPDEGYGRIKPFLDAIERLAAPRVLGRGMGEDDTIVEYGKASDALHGARALRLRYERFESPRPEIHEDPELRSLGSLAP